MRAGYVLSLSVSQVCLGEPLSGPGCCDFCEQVGRDTALLLWWVTALSIGEISDCDRVGGGRMGGEGLVCRIHSCIIGGSLIEDVYAKTIVRGDHSINFYFVNDIKNWSKHQVHKSQKEPINN